MRLRLLVEIRAAALADIHTRERQETRWRQNIHTGAAVCPAFIRKHWEVCCMKIMDKAAFEEQNVFGLGAPNDAFARVLCRPVLSQSPDPPGGRLLLPTSPSSPGAGTTGISTTPPRGGGSCCLHRRRGLVPGGGQRGGQPGARQSHRHPGGGQALARRQAGQLVQPHRRRDAR